MTKLETINNWMQKQIAKIDFFRNGEGAFEAKGAPFILDIQTMQALMSANLGNTLFAHEFNPAEFNDDGAAILCEKEMNVRFITASFHIHRLLKQGNAVFYDHTAQTFRALSSNQAVSTEVMELILESLATQANKTVKEIVRWEKQNTIHAGWHLRVKLY